MYRLRGIHYSIGCALPPVQAVCTLQSDFQAMLQLDLLARSSAPLFAMYSTPPVNYIFLSLSTPHSPTTSPINWSQVRGGVRRGRGGEGARAPVVGAGIVSGQNWICVPSFPMLSSRCCAHASANQRRAYSFSFFSSVPAQMQFGLSHSMRSDPIRSGDDGRMVTLIMNRPHSCRVRRRLPWPIARQKAEGRRKATSCMQ